MRFVIYFALGELFKQCAALKLIELLPPVATATCCYLHHHHHLQEKWSRKSVSCQDRGQRN